MERVLLVRYNEIHLKGLNRPFFEKRLCTNISRALGAQAIKIEKVSGRIIIWGIKPEDEAAAVAKASRVFGVHSISVARVVEKGFDAICEAVVSLAGELIEARGAYTFKVEARRADKRFAMNSNEINRELGARILNAHPALKVDVHTPQVRFGVEIRENVFVYAGEIMGAGGMPMGTNGRAALLLSGGIDSPVAGYMVAKRGVEICAVHFFSFPYTGERSKEKVVSLAKILSGYTGRVRLHIVGFTEIQQKIYENCPDSQITLIIRRFMMRITERIALSEGAAAMITGEAIGQVASQTMDSLAVTDDAVNMPVFRPLIGFDKQEIVERAKLIGTFETSILPYEDCCTVFVPKRPVTHPKITDIRESEAVLDVEKLIEAALENTEIIEISEG